MLHIRTALLKLAADEPTIRSVVLPVTRQAKRWEKMPKGWTDESREKFWATLTGDNKHKVTKCIKEMTDKGGIDNPGAFCAALADRVMGSDWRKGPRKKKGFNSPYNNLPDAQGKGWTAEVKGDTKRWLWSDPTYHISFAIIETEDKRNFLNGEISYLLRVQDSSGKVYQSKKPEMHLASAYYQAKRVMQALRKGEDWTRAFTPSGTKLADTAGDMATAALPTVFKRVLADVKFNKRKIHLRIDNTWSMYSAGDDGAKGFTAIVDMNTGQYKVAWGDWGGGGLGGIKPVDDTKTPRKPIPDHLAIVQGQIGSSAYASITTNDKGMSRLKGGKTAAALVPPKHIKRVVPDGHYQVWLSREGERHPYITDHPTIQVALREAKRYTTLGGVVHVMVYDSLGNQFKSVKKAVQEQTPNANVIDTATWWSMKLAFNKYNAPEVLGQLIALLKQYDLEEPLDLMKRDKIPQVVDKAWKGRDKQARLAELRAQRQAGKPLRLWDTPTPSTHRYYLTVLGTGKADIPDAMRDLKKAAERLGWRQVEIHDEDSR